MSDPSRVLRVIVDPPADGAWNMAVDEALLLSDERTGLTIRFYQWEEPTLSLGYFQSLAEREQHPPSVDCPMVRRASGGGAILHDRELTYSMVAPLDQRDPRAARLQPQREREPAEPGADDRDARRRAPGHRRRTHAEATIARIARPTGTGGRPHSRRSASAAVEVPA